MCTNIVHESDFRIRVVREDKSLEKRGHMGAGDGRRLSYLGAVELPTHSRVIKNNKI